MQGLQEVWDLPRQGYAWATGGYGGAIGSGQTTCGLLIGPTIAMGLKVGLELEGPPIDHKEERQKTIGAVNRVYRDFIEEFKTTDCKKLTGIDFSIPEEAQRYHDEKLWQHKCNRFLSLVMELCIRMDEEGTI